MHERAIHESFVTGGAQAEAGLAAGGVTSQRPSCLETLISDDPRLAGASALVSCAGLQTPQTQYPTFTFVLPTAGRTLFYLCSMLK